MSGGEVRSAWTCHGQVTAAPKLWTGVAQRMNSTGEEERR